jgi:homeobox protein aristaless-related
LGALYSQSASFQSLVANISAARRYTEPPPMPSPEEAQNQQPLEAHQPNAHMPMPSTSPQPAAEDRKSSSIAALRLKAREHETKLEIFRQKGFNVSDLIS